MNGTFDFFIGLPDFIFPGLLSFEVVVGGIAEDLDGGNLQMH